MTNQILSRAGFIRRFLRCNTALSWQVATLGGLVIGFAAPAHAFNTFQVDGWEINLTTQVQYSGAVRVNNPSQLSLNIPNTNEGDQNFQHGMISNEFEVVPSLTVTKGNFGVRVSGEAYINTAYLQNNTNSSPETLNSFQANNKSFNSGTVAIDGRNAELLDAYAFDSVNFGAADQQSVTLKVGRQTLLWGQSLQSNDGIAGGQAPLDINTAVTLANPQVQQILLPVGQAVITYQPVSWVTFQGYYQFEWRPDQFPGNGSYFDNADFLYPGGTRLILAPTPAGPLYLSRGNDVRPSASNGQFGLSAQFQIGNYDVGLFGLRFDSKTPQVYLHLAQVPTLVPGVGVSDGTYQAVYPKDIQLYGASLSTDVGPVNVAGELSGRINQGLYSNAVPDIGYNENSNPGYAVGSVINAQASAIYLTPGLPLMPGGMSLTGEIVYNTVVDITANRSALIAGRTPSALAFTFTATPAYYNVLPNFDLNFPVGFAWTPVGRSQFDASEQAGTGSLNIGVTGSYKTVWKLGLNYQDFLGSASIIPPGNNKQVYADRGNLSFFISRTF